MAVDDLPPDLPDRLPVLPLRDTVTYPDTLTPLAVGQERSIQLVNDALVGNRMLVMLGSKDPDLETPGPEDLHTVGVVGVVARMLKVPDGSLRILVQGGQRVKIEEWIDGERYLVARVSELPDVLEEGPELTALMRNVQQTFTHIIEEVPYLPEELQMAVANLDDPSALGHLIAGALRIKVEERQALLEEVDVGKRLRRLSEILARELDIVAIGTKIQSQVQSEMEDAQREYVLRQQLKAIQAELGEKDPAEAEVDDLRAQLEALDLPEDVRKQADRELGRLEKLPQAAAEHGVIRTYLEWIASLPWGACTEDNLDLQHARDVLDTDHYDIVKVKDRILEFLAVRKLKPDSTGSSIMCFVGPPGVGKTSLGKSIAAAMGRNFERISVGGVRDESEIRGHRRTYIGAMPGTIIRAIRDAESRNPVFLIDEIDKMGADWRGDPASAMLEVLDPEQHSTFRDHYLDLPFDLSKVLFICTANQLETIPGPLLDRMDVIQLSGYTEDEKVQIAKRFLVPKQLEAHGLSAEHVEIDDDALRTIVREYTREAGLRNLERRIADVLRKTALRVAEGESGDVRIDDAAVREALGPRRFSGEARKRTSDPGVATGLAVTAVGGDVLFIEATAYPGKGGLRITGQLGEVMQESAQAALSWVRSHAERLGIDPEWFAEHDIHIHVPAGAVPKDGPSAGVTMATAIVSLATGRTVSEEVGMTGEITLTGQVLQIGGLREKVLAAQRAGLKKVILPHENEADLSELPDETREEITFVLAETADEVLEAALGNGASARPHPATERQAASGP